MYEYQALVTANQPDLDYLAINGDDQPMHLHPWTEQEMFHIEALEPSFRGTWNDSDSRSMIDRQPCPASEDAQDLLIAPIDNLQCPASQAVAYAQNHVASSPWSINPFIQNQDTALDPSSQSSMVRIHVDAAPPNVDRPLPHSFPGAQANHWWEGPSTWFNHPMQGNNTLFRSHGEGYGAEPNAFGTEPAPIPTPSPGSIGHDSPGTPGSLLQESIEHYMNQEEPWRSPAIQPMEHEATQGVHFRERSQGSHGQWIFFRFGVDTA